MKPERAWIIPSDWNEEVDGWRGVCVQIPNSWEWLLLLKSLFYALTIGRSWDAATGSIKDTQAIAWRIFEEMHLFPECGEETAPSPGGTITREMCASLGFGGGVTILEDDMPSGVVTEITFADGKMRVYYGHCCFDEFNIGTAAQQTGGGFDDGVDPANPNNDPAFVYSACSKSHAIVDAVYACVEAAYDAYIQPFPWQIVPTIENAVGYDLDNNHIAELMAFVTSLNLLSISYADLNSPLERQRIICSLFTEVFADDNVGVPDDATFEQIKAIFLRETGPFSPAVDVTRAAVDCFGRHDLDTVARTSSGDAGKNCDCPSGPANIFVDFGQGFAWSHVFDFRLATLPPGSILGATTNTRHTPGQGLWAEPGPDGDRTTARIDIPLEFNDGTATINRVGLMWTTLGDDNYDGAVNAFLRTDSGDLITRAEVQAWSGNNPAPAGVWTLIKQMTVPQNIAVDEPDILVCEVAAFHLPDTNPPAEIQYSNITIAIALAGTGDDPWPSLP